MKPDHHDGVDELLVLYLRKDLILHRVRGLVAAIDVERTSVIELYRLPHCLEILNDIEPSALKLLKFREGIGEQWTGIGDEPVVFFICLKDIMHMPAGIVVKVLWEQRQGVQLQLIHGNWLELLKAGMADEYLRAF